MIKAFVADADRLRPVDEEHAVVVDLEDVGRHRLARARPDAALPVHLDAAHRTPVRRAGSHDNTSSARAAHLPAHSQIPR